jgi:hypothetical protein
LDTSSYAGEDGDGDGEGDTVLPSTRAAGFTPSTEYFARIVLSSAHSLAKDLSLPFEQKNREYTYSVPTIPTP